jgi:hypothetical protein
MITKNRGKILLGPSTFAEKDSAPLEKLLHAEFAAVANPYKRKLVKHELLELLRDDVVGIIAGLESLDREVMQKSKLKVISRCGSGMSNVDLDAAALHHLRPGRRLSRGQYHVLGCCGGPGPGGVSRWHCSSELLHACGLPRGSCGHQRHLKRRALRTYTNTVGISPPFHPAASLSVSTLQSAKR